MNKRSMIYTAFASAVVLSALTMTSEVRADAVSDAQAQLSAQKSALDDAKKKQADAQAKYDSIKAKVQKAQQDKADVEAEIKAATDVINNSDAKKYQIAYDAAEEEADNLTAKNKAAQAQLVAAQKAYSVAKSKLDAAQSAYDEAVKAQSTAESNAAYAKSKVSKAQQKVDDAEQSLNDVKAAQANQIHVSQEWLDTVVQYNQSKSSALADKIHDLSKKYVKQYYPDGIFTFKWVGDDCETEFGVTYHDVAADKENVINYPADLTFDQAKELTLFTANLINPLRKAAGQPLLAVTDSSVRHTMALVKAAYSDVDWKAFEFDGGKAHNVDGMRKYDVQHTMLGNGENMSMGGYANYSTELRLVCDHPNRITMNDLKKWTYDGIIQMLFKDEDSNWGHTTNFICESSSDVTPVFGVTTDKYGFVHHIFFSTRFDDVNVGIGDRWVPTSQIEKFGLTENGDAIPKTPDYQSKISALTKDLRSKQQDLDDANANAKPLLDKIEQAKQTKNKAKSSLTTAQDDFETKQDNLNDAQDTADQVSASIKQSEAKLADLKQKVADTEDELTALEDNAVELQTKLFFANARVTEHTKALTKANEELKAASGTTSSVEEAYNQAVNAYNAAVEEQQKAETKQTEDNESKNTTSKDTSSGNNNQPATSTTTSGTTNDTTSTGKTESNKVAVHVVTEDSYNGESDDSSDSDSSTTTSTSSKGLSNTSSTSSTTSVAKKPKKTFKINRTTLKKLVKKYNKQRKAKAYKKATKSMKKKYVKAIKAAKKLLKKKKLSSAKIKSAYNKIMSAIKKMTHKK